MAGRGPISPSYIVDLVQIANDIFDNAEGRKSKYEVVVPVYQNNFKRSVAEKLIFLTNTGIYQSIDSSFVEELPVGYGSSLFAFKDKFEHGNESGYKFGTIEVTHPDDEPITVSYYYR